MLDLLLITTLGFLGSFGHCAGMCGPLTIAFSLSQSGQAQSWQTHLRFHGLLNLGRILSYALVGAGIGALGSVLVAGGQLAGIESPLRRGLAIVTGLLLVWFGLAQILPQGMPKLPFVHPLAGRLHDRLNAAILGLSRDCHWWTPALLGLVWGLIPCGFLYAAQIKAAETGNLWQGAATMLAFGVGTAPVMLGVGIFASRVSRDRRSQLFRLGGWVSLAIGLLTLLRTGEMADYTGHLALGLLMLALVARPLSRLFPALLQYRRAIGIAAFGLALAHTGHTIAHEFEWNLAALEFLPPLPQAGIWAGAIGLGLLTPAALTSFDAIVQRLGKRWRLIHLLTVPALLLAVVHTVLVGSHFLNQPNLNPLTLNGLNLNGSEGAGYLLTGLLGIITIALLLLRSRRVWSFLSLEKFYGSVR